MSKFKIDCWPDLEFEEPGTSRAVKEQQKYEQELGLNDRRILESEAGKRDKAEREKAFMAAYGIKPKAPEKKPEVNVKETEASLLEALSKRVEALSKKLEGQGISLDDLRETESKIRDLKKTVSLKESSSDQPGISGEVLNLVERFSENQISAMDLLESLERTGFLK